MAGIFNAQIFNNAIFNTGPSDVTNIRNFSLRNWRKWKRDEEDIESGSLPEELRAEALDAVAQVVNAAPPSNDGPAILEALERAQAARRAFEDAYRKAYVEDFVAETVAELWRAEIRKKMRRRKAALMLLH